MRLVVPTMLELPGYVAALERGFCPDNVRGPDATVEILGEIRRDAQRYVAGLTDPSGAGAPIKLPDGTTVPRLPGYVRWMWEGEFVGSIGFRWQPGTAELPQHVLGHVGYAVVPWARKRGYATRALGQMLDLARAVGLPYVTITADPDNVASQRVIEKNGGVRTGEFLRPASYGRDAHTHWRYRIDL